MKETKKESHVSRIADVLEESGHQKYTPLGKINLNNADQKPVVPSVAPEQKDASLQKRKEDTAVSQQPVKPMPKTKPEDATPVKKNPVAETKSVNQPRQKTSEPTRVARPVIADKTTHQQMRRPEYQQSQNHAPVQPERHPSRDSEHARPRALIKATGQSKVSGLFPLCYNPV